MRLEKIIVEDYKSIKKIEWTLTDNITCIVGQNESGKSNLMEVFDFIDSIKINELKYTKHTRRSSDKYTNHEIPNISFYYRVDQKKLDSLFNQYRDFIEDLDMFDFYSYDFILYQTLNETEPYLNFWLLNENDPENKRLLFTPELFETDFYYELILDFTEVLKIKENLDLSFTISINELKNNSDNDTAIYKLLRIAGLKDVSKIPDNKVQLNQYLSRINKDLNKNFIKKYYTQDNTLNFKFVHDTGDIYLQIEDSSESTYSIEERSEGFKYYFNLLIEMATLSLDEENDILFLLDEPGLRLHPSGQRDLLKYLEELSKKYRIIYTTHSPFLINRLYPNRVKILERDLNEGTRFKHKGFSKNWKPMRSALGLNIKDSFYYSDKALIVEGPEDLLFISSLINYFNKEGKLKINTDLFSFIDAGSESNLPSMVQIIMDDERPTLVLIDSDSTSTFNRLNKKVVEINNKEILDLIQVKDFNKDAVSIEDLLPSTILQQATINYAKELIGIDVYAYRTAETEFNLDLSKIKGSRYKTTIAPKLKEFYLEVGTEEAVWDKKSTPISKVGIARHFDLILNSEEFDTTGINFESSFKLIKTITEKLSLLES
jgi:predicted ATP-dependent endonuclease of OLD family